MPVKNPKPSLFAEQVLKTVQAIPTGQTLSYTEVATKAGYNRAARAVGTLMRNNYDPKIPCHRVINSDGSLGAYNRGGEPAKRALLLAEGWEPPGV